MPLAPEEEYWNYQRQRVKNFRNGQSHSHKLSRNQSQLLMSSDYNNTKSAPQPMQTTDYSNAKSPPLHLPRLDTPPWHGKFQSDSNLRRDRFDRVPAVTNKHAKSQPYQSHGDEDSWSEDEDSEDDEEAHPVNHSNTVPYNGAAPGQPYAYPAYPVMMYHTPVMFAPPPMYQQQPQKKRKKQVRYAEQPEYLQGQTPTAWSAGTEEIHPKQQSPELKYIKSSYNPFNTQLSQLLQNYAPGTNKQSNKKKKKNLIKEAYQHFSNHPKFARDFVDDFVSNFVEEDMIPDLLIEEVPKYVSETMSDTNPLYWPALSFSIDFLNDEMPGIIRDVVVDSTNEMVSDYLSDQNNQDPASNIAHLLVADMVLEQARQLVPEVIQELVSDHMDKASVYDTGLTLVDEIIREEAPGLMSDVCEELCIEEIMREEILNPEIENGCQTVALETLQYYGDKLRQHERKEVSRYACDKLLDSFMTTNLAETLGRQAQVWTDQEGPEKLLDMMMFDILLTQQFSVQSSRQKVLDNKPLRRFHEKCFTDVALGVILQELGNSLDEDMADLDEYELGLWNPQQAEPPDWAVLI